MAIPRRTRIPRRGSKRRGQVGAQGERHCPIRGLQDQTTGQFSFLQDLVSLILMSGTAALPTRGLFDARLATLAASSSGYIRADSRNRQSQRGSVGKLIQHEALEAGSLRHCVMG